MIFYLMEVVLKCRGLNVKVKLIMKDEDMLESVVE